MRVCDILMKRFFLPERIFALFAWNRIHYSMNHMLYLSSFKPSPYFILIRNLETNVSISLDPGLEFADNQDGKYFVDSVPIGELCLLQWLQYIHIYDAPKILLCYKKTTLIHYITLIGEKICRSFNLKASNQFSAASTLSLLVTATFDQVLSFIKIILISTS